MSKAEILAEIAQLGVDDRRQIFERLCELQDEDLLRGVGPTDAEKELLDAEEAAFERDGDVGRPWRDVMRELRSGRS